MIVYHTSFLSLFASKICGNDNCKPHLPTMSHFIIHYKQNMMNNFYMICNHYIIFAKYLTYSLNSFICLSTKKRYRVRNNVIIRT